MLTVGVVGATDSARVHRDRYRGIDGVEVGGVAPAHDDTAAGDPAVYDDVSALLGAGIDAVDVCAPAHETAPVVEAAAEAGLPVLSSVPLADTAADAETAADAVNAAGVPFVGGPVTRFGPEYAAIEDGVGEGSSGDPAVVRVERQFPIRERQADWQADAGDAGSVLLDLAALDVALLRWLVGDVTRVFTRRQGARDSEHAVTLLRFEGGAMAHVDTHRATLPDAPYRVTVEVAGVEGNVEFDSGDAAAMRFHDVDGSDPDSYAELPFVDGHGRDAYDHMLAHFRDVAAGDAESRVAIDDALRTTRVALAAVRSADTGTPVAPAEVAR